MKFYGLRTYVKCSFFVQRVGDGGAQFDTLPEYLEESPDVFTLDTLVQHL